MLNDGKFYKYNYKFKNLYFCPNNQIIDSGVLIDKFEDKSRYLVIDYFIIDLQEKKIFTYKYNDSFIYFFYDISKIEIMNEGKEKIIRIINSNGTEATIKVDEFGKIVEYRNEYIKMCDNMLNANLSIKNLYLPNLEECGEAFLGCNLALEKLELPNLKKCGDLFLSCNCILKQLYLPNLEKCGNYFLANSTDLSELDLPNLKTCKDYFLYCNKRLQFLNLPSLQNIGRDFLYSNRPFRDAIITEMYTRSSRKNKK
jgi:hypothetical protein